MIRRLLVLTSCASAVIAAVAVTAAQAKVPVPEKGVTVPGLSTRNEGVVAPGGSHRFSALPAGGGTTVLSIERDGGRVIEAERFDQPLSLPAVTLRGTAGGLSADGSTLVLVQPRLFGERDTVYRLLAVSEEGVLRLEQVIHLRGDFSFDAISPDGSRIYLVEYLSRTDPTDYAVRAYDTDRGRLLRDPIVDPDEPPGEMGGSPLARAMSPGGRWAYTLYDGGLLYGGGEHGHPFVHALDTKRGEAVCIDLDALGGASRLQAMHLDISGDGSTLTVTDPKHGPAAVIDTNTFEVSAPAAPDTDGGNPLPVILGLAAGALLVAGAVTLVVRRRRGGGTGLATGDA